MTEEPFTNDHKDNTDRERRRDQSMNLNAYLGSIESLAGKMLEDGMTQEHLEQLTINKIKDVAEKNNL